MPKKPITNISEDLLDEFFFLGKNNEFILVKTTDEFIRDGHMIYRSREINGKKISCPMRACKGEFEAILTETILKAVFNRS